MSLIPQTQPSKVPVPVNPATAPRLGKKSAEMLSRRGGVQRPVSQFLHPCLTACLLRVILFLFKWTVWASHQARPPAGHLTAHRAALRAVPRALTRCGWAGMTPTSLLPLKVPNGNPPPLQHLYTCWLSVTSGRATTPMQMLILQLRLQPTQGRGLTPGERSKATPREPLWLLWGAIPSMKTGPTTARMSSGPTSCALRWVSMRCQARTRVSLTKGASACMVSREMAGPHWPGETP